MRMIEAFQIKKIYAIGNRLGLVDHESEEDELHVLVNGISGRDSIKKMTYKEASDVIARLEGIQGQSVSQDGRKTGKNRRQHEAKPGGVTTGQQKKIWALMYELKKYDKAPNDVQLGDRLCAAIKKEFGTDATAKDPFAWMDFRQGNNLIEILKGYIESAKRKKRGASDGIDAE